jgi:hypothetical protein
MYFPYQKGRYEVAPGLMPMSKDFGNGAIDQRLIQIDETYSAYRKQFEANRGCEASSKYVCLAVDAEPAAVGAIAERIAMELAKDYPAEVTYTKNGMTGIFQNKLTDEILEFTPNENKVVVKKGKIAYESAWDAIGAQIPEDIAIWRLKEDGSEMLEALHLNSPNHWAADEKIGKSFAEVHTPVAHIEKIVPWAVSILQGILQKGPFVRFAWGVGTDDRLNHHPFAPAGVDETRWRGRRFDPANPKLFTRVERQALLGFPEINRALFTIRTYFQDVDDLKKTHPDAVKGLIAAIESMSPESLIYKGLDQDKNQIIDWLTKCVS